jgi:hypothetical protein
VCQEKTPLPGPAGSPIDGFNDISLLIPQARLGGTKLSTTSHMNSAVQNDENVKIRVVERFLLDFRRKFELIYILRILARGRLHFYLSLSNYASR